MHSSGPEARPANSGEEKPLQIMVDVDKAIEFLPAHPTAEDDLWALVKGATAVSWAWKRNGFEVPEATGEHLLRSNFRKGDEITVVVETGSGFVEKSSIIGNSLPRITGVLLHNTDLQNGAGITAHPEGVDADGDPVTFLFTWEIKGIESEVDTSSLPREMFLEGDMIGLKVTPFDGEDTGVPFVSEEFVAPNAPPFFISVPPLKINGYTYVYQIQGKDPDDDEVTYILVEGPPDMKFDAASGLLTWKIPVNAAGEHRIRIVAEDQKGARAVQEFDLKMSPSS